MPVLKIIFTRKADNDELTIYQHISKTFGEVYANKFRRKLIDLFNTLSSQPYIGRPAKNDTSLRVIIISNKIKLFTK